MPWNKALVVSSLHIAGRKVEKESKCPVLVGTCQNPSNESFSKLAKL